MAEGKRHWWLVNDRDTVDLCPIDPGFPVDLYIATDIRTMIAIWFGRLAWDAGVRSGRIEVTGPGGLRERLRSWFLLSPITIKGEQVANSDVPSKTSSVRTLGTHLAL